MSHVLRCIARAVRRPGPALNGVREFRSDLTMHYDDFERGLAYDSGRELAHIVTGRRWDQCR